MNEVTFKWSNYFKPTPKNLEKLMVGVKGALMTAAGTAVVMEKPYWSTAILISGAIADQLIRFFHQVDEDAHKKISIEFPESMSDQVEIKEEKVK